MEEQGGSADPTHGAPQDGSAKRAERHDGKGKGKERETTFIDRLQASGRMALNAAVAAQPTLTGSNNDKASTNSASASQYQNSASESAFAEASRSHVPAEMGDTLRNHVHISDQASTQYSDFINAAPRLRDTFHPKPQSDQSVQNQSFREQAASDGGDVVQLLSMPEDEPNYADFDEVLSEQEAARLQQALFVNSTSQPAWDHLINFVPEFISDPRNSYEAKSHTGTEDMTAARDSWLQQWHNVLRSYTDEVWGDLEPLVREARHEIETNQSFTDSRSPESKALDRLRQILSHVRGQM